MDLYPTHSSVPKSPLRSALGLLAFGGVTAGAATFGALTTRSGQGLWYRLLRKPPYNPPGWVFGPVWTGLYGLIALSGWRVWRQPSSPERTRALALWGTQLGLNAAWSWIFFGKHRKRAALADLGALFGAVAGYALAARKVDRQAAWLITPYLAWTCFAGLLNEEIVRRNP